MADLAVEWTSAYVSFVEEAAKPFTLDLSIVNEPLSQLAASVSLQEDQVRLVACFVLSIFLGPIYRNLPGATAKHLMGAIIGVLFAQFCIGEGWIHSLISATACYTVMLVSPKSWAPILVFGVSLTYMSIAHIHRMIFTDPTIDFSSPQMILTIKLTSLAYAVRDGAYFARQAKKEDPKPISANRQAMMDERRSKSLPRVPGPLAYFGFAYYFGSFLVGPAFDFYEYMSSVTGSKYEGRPRPSQRHQHWFMAIRSLIFVAFYVVLGKHFSSAHLFAPSFAELSIFGRIGTMMAVLFVERCKYYFVWLIAEAGCISCGFGWTKSKEGDNGSWTAIQNINVKGFELAQSVRDASVEWNKLTATWLRTCVYERSPAALGLFNTYIVSSFWHGFYPGYYLFFLSAGVAQTVGRNARRKLRPYFLPGGPASGMKWLYDALSVISTAFMINYLAMAFVGLSIERSLFAWSSLYYSGHIALVVLFVILAILPSPRKQADSDKTRASSKLTPINNVHQQQHIQQVRHKTE